ncbi:MAG: CPBP family intramembrane metalloprotease [Clostridiales bacterium]|nr:CPBP family intramembrane metalloprotease [Clostridiales bacterium]
MYEKVCSKDLMPVIVICLLAVSSIVSLILSVPSISGMGIIVGVVYFFWIKKKRNLSQTEVGLSRLGLWHHIRNNWLLIIVPSFLNIVAIMLSKLILADYFDHVISRVEGVLTLDKMPVLIIQFIIFAFVEELVWRGVVQHNISKYLKPVTAIIVSSIFFAIAHAAAGPINIVTYDLFFVLLNSIVYGLIFYKTKNIYISSLSHFIANLSGVMIFMSLI